MSDSDNLDLPSSDELDRAAQADDEKRKRSERSCSISSESEKENDDKPVKHVSHSGVLWEVHETKKELKYRSKYFNDPDEVLTHRKLRCTSCCTSLQTLILEGREIYHHPVLKVLMCKSCIEFYGDGNLSLDEDGTGKYCRWCAQGGMLYCCSSCCNAFCKACIKRNLNRSILVDIESEEWRCFVCNGEPLWELRAICKNAYIVSRKIKRKKKEENERNLKKLQKKREKQPLKKSARQLNSWQKNASRKSSTDSEHDSEEDAKKNKNSKKSKNKRKRNMASSSSDGEKHDKKKKKQHDSDSDIAAVVKSDDECIIVEVMDEGTNSKKIEENQEDELPEEVDSEELKEANSLLQEHLNDIIHTGELIAYRAKRLLDKKVSESYLLDPKKVEKVVDSISLLTKLAGENMQHTVEFLNTQHRHWVKKIKKRHRQTKAKTKSSDSSSETVNKKKGNTDDIDAQDLVVDKDENKNSEDADVTMNGIENGVESDEDVKTLKKVKGINEELTKEKDDLETTIEYDNFSKCENVTVDNAEADVVKHDSKNKVKRKHKEGDNDSEVADEIENTTFSENEIQMKKKPKTTLENNENNEKPSQDIDENSLEKQIKSEDKDKNNITNEDCEKVDSKKENAESSFQCSNTSVLEISNTTNKQSDESITSLLTVKVGEALNGSEVDIFADLDSSVQENNKDNIPLTDNDRKQDKLKDNEIHEKMTEEGDSSESEVTIEMVCSEASNKDDDDDDDDDVDDVIESDSVGHLKNQVKKGEVKIDGKDDETVVANENNDDSDPLKLNETCLPSKSRYEIESEKNKVNNEVNPISLLENEIASSKDGVSEDEVNAISNNENKQNTSESEAENVDEDKSQLDYSILEAVKLKSSSEVYQDKESDEKDAEENKKEDCADDCVEAQEALLGYTSDDEDDYEEKRKKRRKKEKIKSKEIDENEKDNSSTKIKKKRPIGPKSKTRQFRSSSSSSSSSATDMDSDNSIKTTQKKEESAKKKKFKLKDTEAYKNDKKLSWKSAVNIERLSKDEFQKYYENYCSDESDEITIKARNDKEIESLLNLKSLKKGKSKKSKETSDSYENSDDNEKSRKKRKTKKDKKKEQEQRLIDFFNEDTDDNEVSSEVASDMSGSENDGTKSAKKKKNMIEKENEMAKESLLANPSSDDTEDDVNEDQENELADEKKKKNKLGEKKDQRGSNDREDTVEVNNDKISEIEEEKIEKEEDQRENNDKKDTVEVNNDKMNEEEEEKIEDDTVNEEEGKDDEKVKVTEEEEKEEEAEIDKKKKDSDENKECNNETKEEHDTNKDEEEEEDNKIKEEEEEEEKDKKNDDDSDGSDKKQNKKNWRKDKLLTAKLTDIDTSDEERLWNKKKQKEKKEEDSDSDMKSKFIKKVSKKKVKRRILGSDDDDDIFEVPSSSSESESNKNSSDSDIIVVKKKKKKKKAKKSDSDASSGSSSDFQPKKPKRRRIKAPASDSSTNEDEDGPSQTSGTPGKGRKKIHHIMSDDNVAEATRKAAKEEEERRRRIADKQRLYNEIYEVKGTEKLEKLVLDFDPETKKELISVDSHIVSKLKPHQAQGIKFMWDACFESLNHIKKNKGSGCILAHCMGLGKSFQIVSLVHTLLKHKETKVETVLVICPLSTVLNWCNEFNKWLKDGEVNVFELTRYKQNYERQYQLKEWIDCGGVMVLGYEMYRNLTNPQAKRFRKKAIETFQRTLVDPGPDVIVCDEGHILKNEDSAIAKALRRVKTLRRIVLTGTPLQNNLKEYHCMVQFVKPNLLGTRKEFLNRFVNPITNGQFEDSTLHDVKIMKRRAHVLHKMLEGSVQRFDYSVLMPFLPPKHEYVISIRLHEVQIKAYRHYMDFYARADNTKGAQLFQDFNNLQRIWTHPRVLQMSADKDERNAEKKRLMESDSEGSLRDFIDDDDDVTTESSNKSSSSSEDTDVQIVGDDEKKEKKPEKTNKYTRNTRSKGPVEETKDVEIVEKENKEDAPPWWKQFMQGSEQESIHYSGKLVLLFTILRECEKIGDKVLVFSQSLLSLDLIEYFLGQIDAATQNGDLKEELGKNTGSWSPGLDYFRLDGSTSSENRHIWCKSFNREDNSRARLFLISTRAGGLGINLFAANRVIIFDASWNPSHDVQSIFRVYRFGQKKPCYIYRFLAQGTMEEKIYDRQVTKLSLSCRVVDEQQIERHYNMADLQELYQFDPEQKTKRPTPILPKDRLLAELLKEHEQWIVTYHEHDSLLENKEEEELNEDERKAAWEEYENEKKGKVVTNLPTPGMGTLNMQALREALRKENPQATEEELEQKMILIMGQIYDFLSNQQNPAPQQKYTAAQLQALQQYQIQQQQMRAQREKQMQMQHDLSFRTAAQTVAGYTPGANVSFQQYLQNQKNAMNNQMGNYQNNMYRHPMLDKSGLLRVQSKIVPINPNSSGTSKLPMKTYGNKNLGPNHLTGHAPVTLPQTSMYQNPPAHSSNLDLRTLLQSGAIETKEKDLNKKSVPDDVVETIE